MQYGYFDYDSKEYVITDPRTPVKWINYIGDLSFGGFVDHTGGALICKGDPALNRITKYIAQMPASDFKGETLYLRIKDGDGYHVFSPFFVPCLVPYERFECRVGLGYTRWITQTLGIEADITVFVPHRAYSEYADREVRIVKITNRRSEPLQVDAIPVVEYSHFDALKQLTNADWVPQTMQSWALPRVYWEDGAEMALCQAAFMKKDSAVNYFTASRKISSFETDRRRFLGDNEYGTWANPLALQQDELSCTEARRGDNIAALMLHLGELSPGKSKAFCTQLGQTASMQEAGRYIFKLQIIQRAEDLLSGLKTGWEIALDRQRVVTPDADMDSMLNIFNPYQCNITLAWSRYLSLYQLGYGARGIGFRDSAQDVMGALPFAAAEGKDLLRKLLSVQLRSGCAMHQFNPLTMIASAGDAEEREDRPHYYSDDALWAVLAVCAYIKESGNFAFLDEVVPFYDKDKHDQALESAPVLEHLYRAVAFTRGDTGAHGLPLLGFADWNDTLNLAQGAESLLTANLYGRALTDLIALCRARGDDDRAAQLQADYDAMGERVRAAGWDGDWFRSYFDADGTPLGSQSNEAGQIYAYGQAWPVLSGYATPEQARQALDAVYERLNTRCGIKLSAPGFNGFDPRKGGITTYPPGAKENGGIFMHVNPWVMIAEAMTGNGARAYAYYAQTNPAAKNERIEEWECEPYVYPQNILSDEHPQFGLARNSWLSGTAAWMYQAATQYILGVRPEYDGLRIDPCIPPEWRMFAVRRAFRGAVYGIGVMNPGHVSRGVAAIEVDGQPIEGSLLPIFGDGKVHRVTVILG